MNNNEIICTFLLNSRGKIIDLLKVLEFGSYSLIITSHGKDEFVMSYLDKYIITEDVRTIKALTDFYCITFFGEDGVSFVKKKFNIHTAENFFTEINEKLFVYEDKFRTERINLVKKGDFNTVLNDTANGHLKLSENEYQFYRISNGIPETENELNPNVNPLEIGGNEFISETKGCYIGQEVIARMISQNKIPRKLVLLKSSNKFEQSCVLTCEGEECGVITSSVKNENGYMGLGLVKNQFAEKNKKFTPADSEKEIFVLKIF